MSRDNLTPTRVLIVSYVFPPSRGGLEQASLMLSRLLAEAGFEVVVVTDSTGHSGEAATLNVIRKPKVVSLLRAMRCADVVVVSNPSLRLQWPLFFIHRPAIYILHTALESWNWKLKLLSSLKLYFLRHSAAVVSVSSPLARSVPVSSVVIPNAINLLSDKSDRERLRGSVISVGRLVHQKGLDVLLKAFAELCEVAGEASLTIVGDGPSRTELEAQVLALGIADRVHFAGWLGQERVAELLREHEIFVMPSRPTEAFGLAALEALAAGCVPIVTASGGPPEAIGNHGLVVPPDDSTALCAAMLNLITHSELRLRLLRDSDGHVGEFGASAVRKSYEDLIRGVLRGV